MKVCPKCDTEKPLERFARRGLDGRSSWCLQCLAEYGRARYAAQKDRVTERWRETRYGVTPARWAEMLNAQGGVCAICAADAPGGRGGWHIDHDHSCCPAGRSCGACVRGLLCHNCNTGLGRFADDTGRLQNAIDYLTTYERRAS